MSDQDYQTLLDNNRRWAEERTAADPDFFPRLAEGQSPPFLFIGCSDSRKPLNVITQTEPGELFIHRNVANQVRTTDLNVTAVLEFAVGVLRVDHLIVCGHTRCGGIAAALGDEARGAVEEWIRPIREIYVRHRDEIDGAGGDQARADRLARLSVVAQVENVCRTAALREAFDAGRRPRVHGWMFRVETGFIEEVELPVDRWRAEALVPEDY